MSDVYILGIDMIKFGRFPEETPATLGAQAALLALDDAGLDIWDVQALFNGNQMWAGGGGAPPEKKSGDDSWMR